MRMSGSWATRYNSWDMPHLKSSWRLNWKKLSKFLCRVGIHFWVYSSVTQKPLKCLECHKKTRYYDQRADL